MGVSYLTEPMVRAKRSFAAEIDRRYAVLREKFSYHPEWPEVAREYWPELLELVDYKTEELTDVQARELFERAMDVRIEER